MEGGDVASPLFWRGEHTRDWVLIVELSPVRRFLYVSPSVADATGYTPEELYADPDLFEKNLHPDDVAHVQEKISTTPTAHTIRTRFKKLPWIPRTPMPSHAPWRRSRAEAPSSRTAEPRPRDIYFSGCPSVPASRGLLERVRCAALRT